MINTIRHKDFFNPIEIDKDIHIIGCGAVGSHIANFLTRLGVSELHLWDFDTVGDHNIPNQMFREKDIGKTKVDALIEQLKEINSDIIIHAHGKYSEEELKGYVFACVDNIEVRKELYLANEYNAFIDTIFDTRVVLDKGQVYTVPWDDDTEKENLILASDFKHDEVEEKTAACGSKLAVLNTMVMVSNIAVTNFMNRVRKKSTRPFISFNTFDLKISR